MQAMLRRSWPFCLPAVLLAAAAGADPKEDALRAALVGKSVTVKIDMPASHRGVDLRFDKEEPFNLGEHYSRIKQYDVAIREGERAPITYVKLKDDMIEIHLAGGGFNWSSDTTTQSYTALSKTSRESDLERRIKAETDRQRKREMQDELDDLRRDRERRDQRRKREVDDYNLEASARDRDKSLRSGSRFNLRFKKEVPQGALSADGVFDYLTKWASASSGSATRAGAAPPPETRDLSWLRKGLLREDVDKRLGRPRSETSCKDGGSACRLASYATFGDDVDVTYVEDVVVKFTIGKR